MEIRKVQLTGGSSYVITLPKEWVRAHSIGKNDPVGVEISPDGSLIISPRVSDEYVRRTKVIDAGGEVKGSFLFRMLVSAYITGYTEIRVVGSPPSNLRNVVRRFAKMAIGEEIVEETPSFILIKDLLNPREMPFGSSIRRMYVLVRGMLEDVISSLKDGDADLARDVVARDDEVDRLHWLVARQHSMVASNLTFAEKMGVSALQAGHYFLVSRYVERIGDHAVRIAENVLEVMGNTMDIAEPVELAGTTAIRIFDRGIESFLRGDVEEANRNIDSVRDLVPLCEEIHGLALRMPGEMAISLAYIAESIRRVGEYSSDISECALNMWGATEKWRPGRDLNPGRGLDRPA